MVDKHRGVRLLEQDMKAYEKIQEKKLRDIVKIKEKRFGFQPGRSTVDAFLYYDSCRKSLEQRRKSFSLSFSVDLEKAFDRVPREAIRWALRRQKVPMLWPNIAMQGQE
mgnify:CR=1 FL=1